MRVVVTLVLLVGSLTGCESMLGLERKAPVARELDMDCVASAIRGVDGVTTVQTSPEGSIEYAIAGTRGDAMHRAANARIHVVGYRWGPKLFHEYKAMNRPPPIHDMEVARRVMVRVEGAIRDRCPSAPDPARYQEKCKSGRCTNGT